MKSEDGRREDRGQRSEVRSQKMEDGRLKTENGKKVGSKV